MPTIRPSSPPIEANAEQDLLRALRASRPEERRQAAQSGLARTVSGENPDTELLLLRQLYLAHIDLRELGKAAEVAERAARCGGDLTDVAWNDLARVREALGNRRSAIEAQRLAVRSAPSARKSFQLFCLATLQNHGDDADGALASLRRAMRYAQRDRALLRAYSSLVRLDHDLPTRGLRRTLESLRSSPNREGYGRYVLGMIAHHMGDEREAQVQLAAFCRRNESADFAKALSLREELERARAVLRGLELQA